MQEAQLDCASILKLAAQSFNLQLGNVPCGLYICATPLGNRADISLRNLHTLSQVDKVYAEDTRVTKTLLASYGISKPVVRMDEALIAARSQEVLDKVAGGKAIAYCSDAGMPGISDPGMRLIARAHKQGIPVFVVPGPSACDMAYVFAGMSAASFHFKGFFPKKKQAQERELSALVQAESAHIYYESPHRIVDTLALVARVLPKRKIALARELTKLHEELIAGTSEELFAEVLARLEDPNRTSSIKGEMVLVIDGASDEERLQNQEESVSSLKAIALAALDEGLSKKDVVSLLRDKHGMSRNAAYDLVQELR